MNEVLYTGFAGHLSAIREVTIEVTNETVGIKWRSTSAAFSINLMARDSKVNGKGLTFELWQGY